MALAFQTGVGALFFEGGSLDDVPYAVELYSHIEDRGTKLHPLESFRGRITLDPSLGKVLVKNSIILTLILQDGRTLMCRLLDTSGGLIRLTGGTL